MSERKRRNQTVESEITKVSKSESQEENDIHKVSKSESQEENDIHKVSKSESQEERGQIIDFTFYDKPALELSKDLLGQRLVRRLSDGLIVSGTIVETEAYLGADDPSAHSYTGQTERNKAMFMAPGTAYVYNIYGSYCCMNISSRGEGHAVLLRALEPCEGLQQMRQLRQIAKKTSTKPLKDKDLCSGPSKFCQALSIDKASVNGLDLTRSDRIWLERGQKVDNIVVSTRIGIEGAGSEAASKPYRFYIRGNVHVSKRDKKAELIE